MAKIFNTSADCRPELHYMVDISERLLKIKAMVDAGQYFTINRARQYWKTTTLQALGELLTIRDTHIKTKIASERKLEYEYNLFPLWHRESIPARSGYHRHNKRRF